MKAAAMSVWVFINLLCFGMCGYLYLIWSQYWMYIERQRLFSKTPGTPQRTNAVASSYQEVIVNKLSTRMSVNYSADNESVRKNRRSAIGVLWSNSLGQTAKTSKVKPPTKVPLNQNVVLQRHGSPRFPNIHKPILEFDSEKYLCDDYLTPECEALTTEFKELLLKEFHRVLMGDSKVFRSGLVSQNIYDVKYNNAHQKDRSREELLCELKKVSVRTVRADDEPFAQLGFRIPPSLQGGRTFDTCAVVSNAGALLGSRLGEFIDSHDMVIRFNNAPTINFTDDVGSKTTLRILNSQVVTKPEYNFLTDSLYDGITILIWDPANYSSTLEDWYRHPDFPLFPVYKRLLDTKPDADVHLLKPEVLWDLWAVLQDSSPYRLRRNPPSSGFIGFWYALQRCRRVRVFEYVPSARATRRCHYYSSATDEGCTLGAWHPLAQEKALAERMRDNMDLDVFQRGFIDVPGLRNIGC